MFSPIIEGIGIGLVLAVFVGPAFFTLIQTSLKSGFKSGVAFATGIVMSDLFCVLLSYFGASQFLDSQQNRALMGIVGGIIIILFGIVNLLQKKTASEKDAVHFIKTNIPILLTKGFFLNLFNPFVWLFWIGTVTTFGSRFDFVTVKMLSFFTATLLTVISTDILKAFVAHKIKSYLKPPIMLGINRVSGIILVGSGIVLIYRVLILKQ